MMDERTYCAICGVNAGGRKYCDAHQAVKAADDRTWCGVCGQPTAGAELCDAHEERRRAWAIADHGKPTWCAVCGRPEPCELHAKAGELEGEAGELLGDELEGDNPAAIAKSPLAKAGRTAKRKGR
jgi:hypothetical protein